MKATVVNFIFLKQISIFFLLISSSFVCAQNYDDRKVLFDYDWKFLLGDTATASAENFNDVSWRTLDIPHDWSIEGTVDPKNPTSGAGGYFPTGVGWYRKTFTAPKEWKDKKISIYFEGVYMNAEVFINGKSLGVYPYGYSAFTYDLSEYLKVEEKNVIAVKVDNIKQPNSRWYSGSGIYRHVWMNVTNKVHVVNWGVSITTRDISSKNARVRIKTVVQNETSVPQSILLKTQIWDEKNNHAGSVQLRIELPANGEKEFMQVASISNPRLWTPDTPNLYIAQVQLVTGNKVIDECKNRFGIRTIDFSSAKGFLLNGDMVKINGGCVHHDNGFLGAAAFDRAEERKVEILKAAGFNAVRTSHNPPSEAFLNACDRLGLLVMDEAFDCWRIGKSKYDYASYFDKWWKRDLEMMVMRDRNHPSVIMWSIGNEIPERGNPEAVETAKMLIKSVKRLDSSRPVTSAIVGNDKDWTAFDSLMNAHDIAGYNYHLESAPIDHERVPARVILQTESYPKDAYKNWSLVQQNNYVIGDFVWTGMDYLGESGIGRSYYSGEVPGEHWEHDLFPWHGAYCGDVDLVGIRKPISHYRNLLYNKTEKLYMAVREPNPEPLEIKQTWWSVWPTWESWTWPGYDGKEMEVDVFSKFDKVRVYLNNSVIGEKLVSSDHKVSFSIPFAPGELKAVGMEQDREIEATVLQTAGSASRIKLTVDRNKILANGQDLAYVLVEVTDSNGLIQPNASNRFHFKIEGPGVIAAVGNADLKDYDSYISDTRKAWHGRAMVVIKSLHHSGEITLHVTSPELSGAAASIEVVNK